MAKIVNGMPDEGARAKIRPLTELGKIAEQARNEGKTVSLCHGVFDLLHLGHVRHLEAASAEADLLIVTVTADRFVNRGPGRPVFPDVMRAEMLASLAYVDWVGVCEAPSAEQAIETIQPNVYLKGQDYENADDDLTGKINAERELVERFGGRLAITKNITFSSSSIINRHLNVLDPKVKEFLTVMRERHPLQEVLSYSEKVRDFKVLVIGDAIVDDYQYVQPMGKSPKENMIATLYQEREVFAGGVFAAANHLAGLCGSVEIITALGSQDSYEGMIRQSLKPNVHLNAISLSGRPTTRKTRFVETGYARKLFEVYFMDDSPLSEFQQNLFSQQIENSIRNADIVLVTDFGHGLIDGRTVDLLTRKARFLAVNAQTNSGNQGYNLITKYPRADYVCIDAPEARLAVADRNSDIGEVISRMLPGRVQCPSMAITHGAHGCVTYAEGQTPFRIPAFTKTVIDTVGAGDAFFAVTAPFVAAQAPMDVVGLFGNSAGAMKVGIVGHRQSIEKVALLKYITTLLK